MIKKFFNVFKTNKSKLTMEELQMCSKIVNISMITFIISMVIIFICMIAATKGIVFGYILAVVFIIWCISLAVITFGRDIDEDIQKFKDGKNIIALIKEGKFDKIYCVDKDINKLLFDISLEKRNVEISIEKGNIVVTIDGIEIPLEIDNVNDYFAMY